MTRPRVRSFVIGAVLILMPAAASAQAALAGVVTDPSGAVIPGVTSRRRARR